jgi:hypothetical protein
VGLKLFSGCLSHYSRPNDETNSSFFLQFYEIPSVILPNGISHFNVSLTNTTTGAETTYDNNGHGYPVQDNIIFQAAQSCRIFDPNANGNLTLTAAVSMSRTSMGVFLY